MLTPTIHPTVYIAPTATVVGDVRLAEEVSIWFGAVLRGDIEPVIVGPRSNVQDGCILHTAAGEPAIVGADVTLGHGAIVHGCRIADNVLVGMGATLLNGVEVGENCLIGARALITQGTIIPPGSLVLGMPARVVRPLTPEEIESIRVSAVHYVEYARRFLAGEI